ncbi:MAG: LLM class flavin-dependent oxidoreductase [Chloroflexi bacterium]|jgi:alkanesulfonate monooxygenase SsuD/methylene tetrahydromethanopterin reductase-like flavin-dependent oxidoreductase (luciferase family)|nr:LLM class flavin-dependent oxidoreductase [Chloroflexota bacterium]
MTRLAPGLTIGFKTSPQGVDLATIEATWQLAGSLPCFDVGWVNDHLTDSALERGGSSLEPMTLLAVLARHVPGKWLGTAVLSNTFRHPAMLAKEATVLDNVTGGRFILGLGAGWHPGEHEAFGIPLPPPAERFDRYESTLRVLRALFSDAGRRPPGVDLDDPFVPLRGATNEPGTIRPDGPMIWLGGQKRRGIELAARFADGWPMPGNMPGDVAYFSARRDEIRRALEAAGRDPDDFSFAGQVVARPAAADRRAALAEAEAFVRAGADHVIVGIAAAHGPAALEAAARDVAEPLRERFG